MTDEMKAWLLGIAIGVIFVISALAVAMSFTTATVGSMFFMNVEESSTFWDCRVMGNQDCSPHATWYGLGYK